VAIPEAEPIVGRYRQRFDEAAVWGVPAHVTVLYPFLDPTAVDALAVATLGSVAQSVAKFDCSFVHTDWFAREVLWLAPDPAEPFCQLTAAVWSAFPQHPPYGGVYDGVVPHLTIGDARSGSFSELELVERTVRQRLPLRTTVESLVLMAGTTRQSSWHIVAELPLSAQTGLES
jgi:2'-5' RNA ligase